MTQTRARAAKAARLAQAAHFHGRWLPRQELDRLLDQGAACAAAPAE